MTAVPGAPQQDLNAPPRKKGPRVFLDYDQAELDSSYTQRDYAANAEQIIERWALLSDWTRSRLGEPERVAYGPTEIEKIDIFRTRQPNAPILVFLHGGAWRRCLAREHAFPAEMFANAGAHYVVPDFVWVQDAGGSLMPMADQVRRAVAWVYRNAASFGGDPKRMYVAGQSSGGHLASVVLVTDWEKNHGLPADIVKGGMCISGMYDLKPVRLSVRSSYVKFDDAMEDALSAQRHIDKLNCPLVVACGTLETPEFQRHARDFAAAVKAAGKPVQLLLGANYNHFEYLDTLANPYSELGSAALEMMKL